MEVWKDIVSRDGIYIGRYQVSDQGRVRAHPDAKGRGMKPGRILFQSMDDRGYPQCELYLGGRCGSRFTGWWPRLFSVHVAKA